MRKELELWQFIHARLTHRENVMLLVVAKSSGSSPGRAGYKMAVASDGSLCGSIGGGVMEENLVEEARSLLSEPGTIASGLRDQVHQKNSPDASGMICSGRQAVIFKLLTPKDSEVTGSIRDAVRINRHISLHISPLSFRLGESSIQNPTEFERSGDVEFIYRELLASPNLYIIGGGHCALALSEMMSKLGFRISIFDDRPELNTIEKNEFADYATIIDEYVKISEYLPNDAEAYVVVMTLGYSSDKVVIKQLCDREFKYFGVLGSKAKMATLMKELKEAGTDPDRLARIRTPIGIPINSRTPEEIAVSIAAEIISVKNA